MKDPKVFADCCQLCITLFERTKSFPKAMRPSIGGRLEKTALDLLISVRGASRSKNGERLRNLKLASKLLDEIKLLIQLAKDIKVLSVGGYGELCSLTLEIGKELGGFLRYEQKRRSFAKTENLQL